MKKWQDLVYALNDLRDDDVTDAAYDCDEVEHVPRVTEVVLHRHHHLVAMTTSTSPSPSRRKTRRSQHSQEFHDPRRQWFSCHVTLTFDLK